MRLEEAVAWAALGLGLLVGILLGVQTSRLGRVEKQLRALTRGAGAGAAEKSLAELVAGQGTSIESMRDRLDGLREAIASLEKAVARSVQYVGLVRYNPFQEAGGDQSFALALMNKHHDGVVISSLHSRTATRFYAKPIKAGTSSVTLSEEEMQALQQAIASGDKLSAKG
ncbi:MAG TPA: DUF4446 family protein [Chloroflexia bacterium]|nr:DUF4446 family protein [Chloroflexia bacterium]